MRYGGLRRKKIDESLLSPKERERLRLYRLKQDTIEVLRLQAMQAGVLLSSEIRYGLLVAALQLSRASILSQSGEQLMLSVPASILEEFTAEVVSILEESAGRVLGTAVRVELVVDRR